jgi:uncharacterized protein (DUF1330 family)
MKHLQLQTKAALTIWAAMSLTLSGGYAMANDSGVASSEPTAQQVETVRQNADLDAPFDMVNLIKYRPLAVYSSDEDNALGRTGREAYKAYTDIVLPMIAELGGSIAYRAANQNQFVGHAGQDYDDIIIVSYPSRRAYLEMFDTETYKGALKHRKAGLEYRVLHQVETKSTFSNWTLRIALWLQKAERSLLGAGD